MDTLHFLKGIRSETDGNMILKSILWLHGSPCRPSKSVGHRRRGFLGHRVPPLRTDEVGIRPTPKEFGPKTVAWWYNLISPIKEPVRTAAGDIEERIGTVVIRVQWRVLHRLKPQSTISIESAERQEKMLPHRLIRLISGFFLCFSYSLGSGGPHSWGLTLQGWSMRFRISALLVDVGGKGSLQSVFGGHYLPPQSCQMLLVLEPNPWTHFGQPGKAVTQKPGNLYPILAG